VRLGFLVDVSTENSAVADVICGTDSAAE